MRPDAGPWKVNPRWVLDSENYNEWMNPVDYETEDAIAEQERLGLLIEGPSGACLCCTPCHLLEPMPVDTSILDMENPASH